MDKQYQHLSAEERAAIMIEHGKGASLRAIARTLDRDVGTISREVSRNRLPESMLLVAAPEAYDATTAAMAYRLRRQRCGRTRKLVEGTRLHQHVHDRLVYWRWSPEQIESPRESWRLQLLRTAKGTEAIKSGITVRNQRNQWNKRNQDQINFPITRD